MKNFIKNFIHEIKMYKLNNPLKYCNLYKDKGCCYVDGLFCNYPNCSLLKEYRIKLILKNKK